MSGAKRGLGSLARGETWRTDVERIGRADSVGAEPHAGSTVRSLHVTIGVGLGRKVPPGLAGPKGRDCLAIKGEFPRDRTAGFPSRESGADVQDVVGRELGPPVPLASSATAPLDSVANVVCVSAGYEVVRTDAGGRVALMPNHFGITRDRAMLQRIGNTVGRNPPAAPSVSDAYRSVPAIVGTASPKPAGTGFIYTSPESLFDCAEVVDHRRGKCVGICPQFRHSPVSRYPRRSAETIVISGTIQCVRHTCWTYAGCPVRRLSSARHRRACMAALRRAPLKPVREMCGKPAPARIRSSRS